MRGVVASRSAATTISELREAILASDSSGDLLGSLLLVTHHIAQHVEVML